MSAPLVIIPQDVSSLFEAEMRPMPHLTGDEKALLGVLHSHWCRDQKIQSKEYLGEGIGRKPRWIGKLLSSLEKKGEIAVSRRKGITSEYGPSVARESLWRRCRVVGGAPVAGFIGQDHGPIPHPASFPALAPPSRPIPGFMALSNSVDNLSRGSPNPRTLVPDHPRTTVPDHPRTAIPLVPPKNYKLPLPGISTPSPDVKGEEFLRQGGRPRGGGAPSFRECDGWPAGTNCFDVFRAMFAGDRRQPVERLREEIIRGRKSGKQFWIQYKKRPLEIREIKLSSDGQAFWVHYFSPVDGGIGMTKQLQRRWIANFKIGVVWRVQP